MLKAELLSIVLNVRSQYESYRIDNLAALHGHTVIRLPPYHCELNSIEFIWSQVKDYIASNNTTFKEDEVMRLTHEAIDNITPELWTKEVKHVLNIEEQMWQLDGLVDVEVDKLVNEKSRRINKKYSADEVDLFAVLYPDQIPYQDRGITLGSTDEDSSES
ncbi:hypothetical protein JTE90_029251 [Oedothorax gibbosus]|uniref:Tc1-like transposase DDE domain-containing protein n=1 Tax=Oedothorax gibbosus TaxID=931172 RepID=A0AAV6TVT3_9ARAC|nr:hypothetical protein JTE90_029251 [Oedothorax gibbosus]